MCLWIWNVFSSEQCSPWASCLMFVCLEFFVPLENLSLIWRRHHCRWETAFFYPCSTLMATKQWGFFSVPHLLWHGASVNNGHLRGPVTLAPNAERVAVRLSLPVLTILVCRGWDSKTQPSAWGANALTHCTTAAACWLLFLLFLFVCIWHFNSFLKNYFWIIVLPFN